jgi:hypothetical protein
MSAPSETKPTLVPTKRIAEKHKVSDRTIKRWVESEIIRERFVRINGRNYLPANAEPRRDGGDAA